MDFVKGQLVRSKAGRDKTRTYAVLDVEGEILALADGSHRTCLLYTSPSPRD